MTFWLLSLVGWAIAYLLGSLPTGYIAGKWVRGIDIREHGSQSVGATNVLRTVGKWPALAVLLIDMLKGVAAILFAAWFFHGSYAWPATTLPAGLEVQAWLPWAVAVAGLAALLGHSRSIWLSFTGGKSAATGLGVLLAISWPTALGAAAVFGVVLAAFRIVSLGSIVAALAAVVVVLSFDAPWPYRLLVISGAAYVTALHRSSMRRLLAGTEPRLGQHTPRTE